MLHGIPAEFLRINKITQNFRTAFSLVLLEMLLKEEKNCACGKTYFLSSSLFLSFLLSVALSLQMRVSWYWWGEHTTPRLPTSLSSSTIKGSYKPQSSRNQCQSPHFLATRTNCRVNHQFNYKPWATTILFNTEQRQCLNSQGLALMSFVMMQKVKC